MIALVLIGAMPLGLGWLINWYMTIHPETFPPLFIVGAALLLAWGVVSWRVNRRMLNTGLVVLSQNAVGAVMLLLVGIQSLQGAFWENLVGVMSQMFYMPMLYFSNIFFRWMGMFGIFFASFAMMLLVSFIGSKIAEK